MIHNKHIFKFLANTSYIAVLSLTLMIKLHAQESDANKHLNLTPHHLEAWSPEPPFDK